MGGRRGRFRLIRVGCVRNADTGILTRPRAVSTAERLKATRLRQKEDPLIWEAAEEDVIGAGDGSSAQVAGKSGVIEARLEIIVVMSHGLVERIGIVGGQEVGLPVKEEVLVVMEKDKIDEPFDEVRGMGIEKFCFWIQVFDFGKGEGMGRK